MEYSYPIEFDWSTEEVVAVIHFYEIVEKVYASRIKREEVMDAYRAFKEVVPGKADEKRYFQQFREESGLDPYPVVKSAKEKEDEEWVKAPELVNKKGKR
ncbi:UPF0223 family protein [Bacillus fonticola]|uniref:UPF0223 family protein n=1 Tax=Bacillus fonticola TaxID=2728853 RepID=UPI00147368C1|nr:UPF0223 family protein [Bacillus fonticola]